MRRLFEVDVHLHAGLERNVDLDYLVDWAVLDGRKILALIDHDFLYWREPREFEAWLRRERLTRNYPRGVEGLKKFYSDVARQRERWRGETMIFQAIEVFNEKLGQKGFKALPEEVFKGLDIFALEVRTYGDQPGAGAILREWVLRLDELCKEKDLVGVLCHPFMYTVEKFYRRGEINRANLKAGLIYLPEELAAFTDGLRLERVFIEVNWSIIARLYRDYYRLFEMVANAFKILRDAGLSFSLGSDLHKYPPVIPYRPDGPYREMGLSPEDFGIIEALEERYSRLYS